MSIQLICPSGHTLTVADAWAGRAGRCPVCKAVVQVPSLPPPVVLSPSQPSPPPLPTMTVTARPASSRVGRVREAHAVPAQGEPRQAPDPTGSVPEINDTTPTSLEASPPSSDATSAYETPDATPPAALQPPPLPAPALPLQSQHEGAAISQVRPESTTAFQGRREPTTNVQVCPPSIASKEIPSTATDARSRNETTSPPAAIAVPTISPPKTGYQPDSDKRWTTYYLAAAMISLSLFCLAPALPYANLGLAPNWARAVLLLSLLQLAYGAWAASIPDWSTLRASMIVLTFVAALYALIMTVALTTPLEDTLPLDLTDVRRQTILWCTGVILLASLLAYLCGRAAWRWRRTLELLQV
jgi:hypothetical protein